MNQTVKKISLCAGLLMLNSISLASGLDEYTSAKPLLFQALEDPNSIVKGELVGPIAEKISETTKSTAPVIATVTTLKQFEQEGCSRLNLHLQQGEVKTSDGKLVDFSVDYGLNLCKNGSPPVEGMDLGKVAPVLDGAYSN